MAPRPGYLFLPVDVEFMEDDKIAEAGEAAGWLYLAMCLRSKQLASDGYLTARQVERLPVTDTRPRLEALLAVGLVEAMEDNRVRVVAWERHNSTAAAITEKSKKKAAGAALGNHRRWHEAKGVSDPSCDHCAISTPIGTESVERFAIRSGSESTETETEVKTETEAVATESHKPPRTKGIKTSAPDVFPITDAMAAWGRENAPLVTDPQAETRQFLDHARANGKTFIDWHAAWRTWMGNAQKYAGQRGANVRNLNPRQAPPGTHPHLAHLYEQS